MAASPALGVSGLEDSLSLKGTCYELFTLSILIYFTLLEICSMSESDTVWASISANF